MSDEEDRIIWDFGRVVFYGRFEAGKPTGWWLYRAADGSLASSPPPEIVSRETLEADSEKV